MLPPQSPQGRRGSWGWEGAGNALPVWDRDEEETVLDANAHPDGREQGGPLADGRGGTG